MNARTTRTSWRLRLECGHRVYRPARPKRPDGFCGFCGERRPVMVVELIGGADYGRECPRGHIGRWTRNTRGTLTCLDCARAHTEVWRMRKGA